MNHLDYITKKCQEANPKLLIPISGTIPTDHVILSVIGKVNGFGEVKTYWPLPQLSDVLKSLGDGFCIRWRDGMILEKYFYWIECDVYYDLSKPLSEQSPDVLQWIAIHLWYTNN